MHKPTQRSIDEILDAYRDYLLSKVSKVRILGEADERELKDVFVELTVVEQRAPQQHTEFLGMIDSATRGRLNPFADERRAHGDDADEDDEDEDGNTLPELPGQREKETKHRVKPDELLRRGTKAIVSGAPGCGKTTLFKYLALQAQQREKRLTVWLELKAVGRPLFDEAEKAAARDGNLILQELWLRHLTPQFSLSDAEIRLLRGHWQERSKANEIVVLLDGFDELQDEAVERSLNKCVREFAAASHDNALLVSTRPYAQHKLGKERLQELEIEPLDRRQIEAFLKCYYLGDAAAKSLLKNLRARPPLRELLHVPLLLGVILRLHREGRFAGEPAELYGTIIVDLVRELDRSKSVARRFRIDDERLRLDFLKFLAFARLLRDPQDGEGRDANRLVFSYDLLREKARTFLARERPALHPRDLADDALATPLLREVGTDTFAFIHLTLQEYLAARAFATFHEGDEYEGLKILCRAYHDPAIVEMEVLPMALGAAAKADGLYAAIERWPESLTLANFRLRMRGLAYGARISDQRLSKLVDRVLEFIAERTPGTFPYRVPILRGLIGLKGRHAETVVGRIAALLEDKHSLASDRAAYVLGKIGNDKAVGPLVKALGTKSGPLTWSAMTALQEIGSDQTVRALIAALGDKSRRWPAALALGNIGSRKAVDALVETLDREWSYYRQKRAEALGKIGSDKAVAALIEALSDEDSDVRWSATEALARFRSDKAVTAMVEALGGKDSDVRASVIYALGKIGGEKAVAALIETLGDEDDALRRRAASALGEIGGEKAVNALIKTLSGGDSDLRMTAAYALGELGDETGVDVLLKALGDRDSDVRASAASVLAKTASHKALDAMIKALGDKNSLVRSGAADALGKIRDEKAVEPLIKALNDEDGAVTSSAVWALKKIGSEKAVDALIKALVSRDSTVRWDAAAALVQVGSDAAVDAVIGTLRDKNSKVRERAADMLGKIRSERAVEALNETLRDRWWRVRSSAAYALGEIGSERAVDALVEALGDKNPDVRGRARASLTQIRSEKAVDSLLEFLSHRDEGLRRDAAEALVHVRRSTLSRALEKALSSGDGAARRKATQAVAYYSLEPRVLEKLSRMAATDPAEETRAAATEAKEKFARKLELFGHFMAEGAARPLGDSESRELFLLGEAFRVAAEAGHIFRPTPNSDWGIDGEIEFKNERGEASGLRVYLQLKSGDSYLRTRKSDSKEIFALKKTRHAEYWRSQRYPVMLVIRDSLGRIRWMDVSEYLQRRGANVRQIEFRGEPFTAENVKRMRDRLAR